VAFASAEGVDGPVKSVADLLATARGCDLVSSVYKTWERANPGEEKLLTGYWANGGVAPSLKTAYGQARVLDAQAYWLAKTPAPAPAPAPTPAPPPAPANPFTDMVGVCAYRTSDLDLIAGLGVKHIRMDNPSAATIDLARGKGLEVLPIAGYCPWSDLNGGKGDHTPPLPGNVATWARRMVDQWRSMSHPPAVFEPWNEPWNFWDTPKDPALYLMMVRAFAAEAWAVWPDATILVSADPNDITLGGRKIHWRDALLAADTGKFLTDSRVQPTVHIYCGNQTPEHRSANPCQWDFDRYLCVYDDFKAHGHPGPVVWPTEFGWETSTTGGTAERADLVTEDEQAAYIVAGFRRLLASGVCARGYGFAFKTDEPDDYDWLRPDNTMKPVCAAVKGMLA
jgi:hypothetical protein